MVLHKVQYCLIKIMNYNIIITVYNFDRNVFRLYILTLTIWDVLVRYIIIIKYYDIKYSQML